MHEKKILPLGMHLCVRMYIFQWQLRTFTQTISYPHSSIYLLLFFPTEVNIVEKQQETNDSRKSIIIVSWQ